MVGEKSKLVETAGAARENSSRSSPASRIEASREVVRGIAAQACKPSKNSQSNARNMKTKYLGKEVTGRTPGNETL
jgi:hypothetical protein